MNKIQAMLLATLLMLAGAHVENVCERLGLIKPAFEIVYEYGGTDK